MIERLCHFSAVIIKALGAVSICGLAVAPMVQAETTSPHLSNHQMLVYGADEVFASHIVYKDPHNVQTILQLSLPGPILADYLASKAANPGSAFILLLKQLDIKAIESATELNGTLLREDVDGTRTTIKDVALARDQFKVLFFNELPLSLDGASHHHGRSSSTEREANLMWASCNSSAECRNGYICTAQCGRPGYCSPIF